MAIRKYILDINKLFKKLSGTPTFINTLPNFTDEQQEFNNRLLFTEFSTDVLSMAPSCSCGNKNVAFGYMIDSICPICKKKVVSKTDAVLESQLWMKAPIGVAEFINPIVWTHLRDYLAIAKGDFDLLLWLTTTDTHFPKFRVMQEEILATGIERGYNKFVNNFSRYLDLLNKTSAFKKSNKKQRWGQLLHILKTNRNSIFTPVLPVIHRDQLVMTTESKGRYVDSTAPMCLEACRLILGIDHEKTYLRQSARENRTAKMLSIMCDFYALYFKTNFASKGGLVRRHLCSERAGNTMRCVITSVTKPHRHDRLEFPWGPSVGMMRQHLQNRLSKYGMRTNDVFGFLSALVTNYHPLAAKIFKDLIEESRDGAIMGTFTRNPSLHRSSMQRMGGWIVKDDPNDMTIGLPATSVVGFNADLN